MRQENECLVEDWQLTPFNSNIEMLSGFPFDSNNFNDSEGKPLIRIRNIISGTTTTLFKGEYSKDYLIKKGDILVGMDGDFHIKKWKSSEALLNQRILKLYESKNSEINLNFFFYLSQPFLLKVHKRTAGTTVKHLSTKDFKNASFKIPNYKEQQKIAKILGTVDTKIEIIDEQIAETQELKKGLMQRLLTKGVGHTEFKESPFGDIPKSWEVVKIQDLLDEGKIVSHLDGNHGGLYPKADEFVDEGVPYVSANCFLNSKVDFSRCKYLSLERSLKFRKGVAKNGDVLFAHNATVGPVAFLETELNFVILSTTATYFRLDNKTIDSKYWLFFLSSPFFKNQYKKVMGQSTRNQVPITMQRSFFSVIPSFKEQKGISEVLHTVNEKLEVLLEKKETYQELKKGLMQKLLTGKVRVKL